MHWKLLSPAGLMLLLAIALKVVTTCEGLRAQKRHQPVSSGVWWGSKLSAVAVCGFSAKVASDSGDELSAQVLLIAVPLVTLLVTALAWHRHQRHTP